MVPTTSNGGSGSRNRSRSENMVLRIRRDIVRAVLQPGEHLGQAQLAEHYAISKVPVREALKQLYAEGLLQYDRNRGYFVSRLSRSEALQLYKLRRWIESELLRTARWPDAEEIAEMRHLFATISQPIPHENREKWLKALTDLRIRMYRLSSEKYLMREAVRLWTLTDRFRAYLPMNKSATGELALFEALVRQDREALLDAHHKDRLRIEALLVEALDVLPAYWLDDVEDTSLSD